MHVVIRYFDIFGNWGICHAKSGQSAFPSHVNKFSSRADAVKFAESKNCKVIHQDCDVLQDY